MNISSCTPAEILRNEVPECARFDFHTCELCFLISKLIGRSNILTAPTETPPPPILPPSSCPATVKGSSLADHNAKAMLANFGLLGGGTRRAKKRSETGFWACHSVEFNGCLSRSIYGSADAGFSDL